MQQGGRLARRVALSLLLAGHGVLAPRRLHTALRLLLSGGPEAVRLRAREFLVHRRTLRDPQAAPAPPTRQPGPSYPARFPAIEQLRRAYAPVAAALPTNAPGITVVVSVHDTPEPLFRACIESVRQQFYDGWELVLVDDASTAGHVAALLDEAEADPRIRVLRRPVNGRFAQAANDGIAAATQAFVAFLDHDDELLPHALLLVAEALAGTPAPDVVYTDQVKVDERGEIIDHFFKPDWSPVYLCGAMYVGHLLVVRTSLLRRLNGFDPAYDGVQDFELMLRASEATARIHHLPEALYKWRAVAGSIAQHADAKPGIAAAQQRAVQAHLARRGLGWSAAPHPSLPHRLELTAAAGRRQQRVSIVIPTRDLGRVVERCLDSIFERTRCRDFEVVVVDNGSTDPVALAAFERHPVIRVPYDRPFNFSEACNLGAAAATGEFLLFLNNDTEVLDAGWLDDLLMFFEDERIGIVGTVLLYPDGTVQHAGVVLGARGTADHVMRGLSQESDGYGGSLCCAREVSAVTGACLLVRRTLFDEVGRFSTDYARHYQDVDLCLQVRERGYRIVCAARPRLVHHESLTRRAAGYDHVDRAILIDRWWHRIAAPDPYYNPHLDGQALDYGLRSLL